MNISGKRQQQYNAGSFLNFSLNDLGRGLGESEVIGESFLFKFSGISFDSSFNLVPHSAQKIASSRFSFPQLEHFFFFFSQHMFYRISVVKKQ